MYTIDYASIVCCVSAGNADVYALTCCKCCCMLSRIVSKTSVTYDEMFMMICILMSTVMLVVFVAEQNRKRTQPTESAPAILEQYRGMYVSASVLCEKCWVQRALAGIASLLKLKGRSGCVIAKTTVERGFAKKCLPMIECVSL